MVVIVDQKGSDGGKETSHTASMKVAGQIRLRADAHSIDKFGEGVMATSPKENAGAVGCP